MTSPLLLVLLLGAAQSTKSMSPSSDVNSNPLLVASNAGGKTLVRTQPGTTVPIACSTWTNTLLWSSSFNNSAWTKGSGISVSADAASAPDGTTTADRATVPTPGAGSSAYQTISGLAPLTTYTMSLWVWTDTGTKTFRLSRTNHATWVTATVSPTFTATTDPQMFSLTYTTGAEETVSDFNVGSEMKTPFTQSEGFYFYWGGAHTIGSTVKRGTITTTDASVTACR